MALLVEQADYTCGSALIPPDHVLFGTCSLIKKITCVNPVVPYYFGSRAKFPVVCYNCGDVEPLPITAEMKENFQTIHPVCAACKARGVKERTRLKAKKNENCDVYFATMTFVLVFRFCI